MMVVEYLRRWCSAITASYKPTVQLRTALGATVAMRTQNRGAALRRPRYLLVDISTLATTDAKTGIQRVTRSILQQWLANPPMGFEVRPVCASHWRTYHFCDYAHIGLTPNPDLASSMHPTPAQAGDIFISLDLTAHILPRHHLQLEDWKMRGVKIFFVVYDLLPTMHPEWFTKRGTAAQRKWLRSMAIYADGAMCISRAVAAELRAWLDQTLGVHSQEVAVLSFPLGADISKSIPTRVDGENCIGAFSIVKASANVLMVGTLEPRKGHDFVLSAFEQLWIKGEQVCLIIVGKVGWKVEALVARLRSHPEAGKRLHWFENTTDEILCAYYEQCSGLLMASKGEGFGLPIVEAASHGLPILARDLPIFREISNHSATYFSTNLPSELAGTLKTWLDAIHSGTAIKPHKIKIHSWRESADSLFGQVVQLT